MTFFVTQDYYSCVSVTFDLALKYCRVSDIGDLVSVLIFIKCGWLFMLVTIASIFQRIENGWATVVKYATNVVYLGTHFFPQFLENSEDLIIMHIT